MKRRYRKLSRTLGSAADESASCHHLRRYDLQTVNAHCAWAAYSLHKIQKTRINYVRMTNNRRAPHNQQNLRETTAMSVDVVAVFRDANYVHTGWVCVANGLPLSTMWKARERERIRDDKIYNNIAWLGGVVVIGYAAIFDSEFLRLTKQQTTTKSEVIESWRAHICDKKKN